MVTFLLGRHPIRKASSYHVIHLSRCVMRVSGRIVNELGGWGG